MGLRALSSRRSGDLAAAAWAPLPPRCGEIGGDLSGAGFLPRFQRRRLDKARQRKEEKAADRLEQELLQGSLF